MDTLTQFCGESQPQYGQHGPHYRFTPLEALPGLSLHVWAAGTVAHSYEHLREELGLEMRHTCWRSHHPDPT